MTRLILLALIAVVSALPASAKDLRQGGKLLLTNGITTIEGSSGGGLASWAVIAGNETRDGIGGGASITGILLPDFTLQTYTAAVGFHNRVEVSFARQNFNTGDFGAALGIGQDYSLNQDILGAKLRLFGDVVYGDPLVPQVSVGAVKKWAKDGPIARAVGAGRADDTEVYISATKLFLARSILANGTLRLTRANQFGLLGFGGGDRLDHRVEIEASLAYQISRRIAAGAEIRTKSNRLAFAEEQDAVDIFVVYAPSRNFTLTLAYVDIGPVATSKPQRGALAQFQAAF